MSIVAGQSTNGYSGYSQNPNFPARARQEKLADESNQSNPTPRQAAHAAAHAALLALAETAHIPCRGHGRDAWTSESPDLQQVAARACRTCPIFVECRTYGIAFPKESGVYGGLTDKQRRNAARTKLKENRA